MEILMYSAMLTLVLCIAGTAVIVAIAFLWIAKQIYNESKSNKNDGVCNYARYSELDDYNTDCGNEFYDATESGNPVTDWAKFCPYCGRKINCKN